MVCLSTKHHGLDTPVLGTHHFIQNYFGRVCQALLNFLSLRILNAWKNNQFLWKTKHPELPYLLVRVAGYFACLEEKIKYVLVTITQCDNLSTITILTFFSGYFCQLLTWATNQKKLFFNGKCNWYFRTLTDLAMIWNVSFIDLLNILLFIHK